MRVLVVETYYDAFLRSYYDQHPAILERPYAEQLAHLLGIRFGCGDAHAAGLRRAGGEAEVIIANANPLQRAWAAQHDVVLGEAGRRWHPEILAAQVRRYAPDVLFVQELSCAGDEVMAELKPHARLIVGQLGCSWPAKRTFAHHDLMISPWKPIVEHFRAQGRPSEFLRLGFDAEALRFVGEPDVRHPVTFVGGLSEVHRERVRLLEYLCRETEVRIFGYGRETLPPESAVSRNHHGPVWGVEMYRTLAASAITLNGHGAIEVGGKTVNTLASNSRLFEATGVGTFLLTDAKDDLHEAFAPGAEMETYATAEECLDKIRRYLGDASGRQAVAEAGRRRTWAEHTYVHRMASFAEMCRARLSAL